MSPDTRCEEIRELAPELALDLVDGHERDAAIRHLAGCAACRGEVAGFSAVADELLHQVPAADPPAGFHARTLARLTVPPSRRRWVGCTAVAASIAIAFTLGLGTAYRAMTDDRRLAESYRGVLAEGNGAFFTVASLHRDDGRVGTAWGYQGDPSWLFASVTDPAVSGWYRASVVTVDGRVLPMGRAWFEGDHPGWGVALPVDLAEVRELRFHAEDGTLAFVAKLDPASPWE